MLICKHVLNQIEEIPRFGKPINNSFLRTVCYTVFYACYLFKSILMNLSTKVVGKTFFFSTSFK